MGSGMKYNYMKGEELTAELLAELDKDIMNLPSNLAFIGKCKRGTINLACAKTGVGKSWFLMQLAAVLSLSNPVLYVSLENDVGTDLERVLMLRDVYKGCIGKNFVYTRLNVWDLEVYRSDYDLLAYFDYIIIDGLDYVVDAGTDKSFDAYKDLLHSIQDRFPRACVWLSWQMGRKFETGEPSIEDIAFSYAAARIAYSAVAVYINKGERLVKSIKNRGAKRDVIAHMEWGKDFRIEHPKKMLLNVLELNGEMKSGHKKLPSQYQLV